jgi:hypothetical protein
MGEETTMKRTTKQIEKEWQDVQAGWDADSKATVDVRLLPIRKSR